MRQPMIQRAQRGMQSGTTKSSPAPIGGWNARDPESAMKASDALWMENWWPGTADTTVRKGAAFQQQGLGGNVLSLMSYDSPTKKQLFAATNNQIYDVTTTGGTPSPVQGITKGEFCHVNFTVAGGAYLLAVNGKDKLQAYNGTVWQGIDNTTTPAITGIDTTQIININVFKRRIWFVKKDSMSAYYLPVNLIAGAAVELPLGQLFTGGGSLVAIGTWTIDGGQGADDYCAFITSAGECAVYRGTDPTSGTGDFQLVGVYYIGEPIGVKCTVKYGGDLLILTQTGLCPLSKLLLNATINRASAISNKIDLVFSQCASAYGNNYGWQATVFPTENVLIVNVPTQEQYSSNQLCMNTITGAWCLFTGWEAFCWEVHDKVLYFGGAGFVAQALVGYNDFGNNIVAQVRQAFNYFGTYNQKHISMIRPLIKVDGNIFIELGVDVDFQDVALNSAVQFGQSVKSNWDEALWDTAVWGADYNAERDWRSVFCKEGFCMALRLRVAAKNVRVGWSSTDFLLKKGGVL